MRSAGFRSGAGTVKMNLKGQDTCKVRDMIREWSCTHEIENGAYGQVVWVTMNYICNKSN